jgi:hypothetical protein
MIRTTTLSGFEEVVSDEALVVDKQLIQSWYSLKFVIYVLKFTI